MANNMSDCNDLLVGSGGLLSQIALDLRPIIHLQAAVVSALQRTLHVLNAKSVYFAFVPRSNQTSVSLYLVCALPNYAGAKTIGSEGIGTKIANLVFPIGTNLSRRWLADGCDFPKHYQIQSAFSGGRECAHFGVGDASRSFDPAVLQAFVSGLYGYFAEYLISEEINSKVNTSKQFFDVLCHELKTPLAPIIRGLDVIGREIKGEYKPIAQEMQRAAVRLAHSTDIIIMAAHIRSISDADVDGRFVLHHALQQFEVQMCNMSDSRGITIELEMPKNTAIDPSSWLVNGSRAWLVKMLLFSSLAAMSATSTRHISFHLTAEMEGSSGVLLQMRMRDLPIPPVPEPVHVAEAAVPIVPSASSVSNASNVSLISGSPKTPPMANFNLSRRQNAHVTSPVVSMVGMRSTSSSALMATSSAPYGLSGSGTTLGAYVHSHSHGGHNPFYAAGTATGATVPTSPHSALSLNLTSDSGSGSGAGRVLARSHSSHGVQYEGEASSTGVSGSSTHRPHHQPMIARPQYNTQPISPMYSNTHSHGHGHPHTHGPTYTALPQSVSHTSLHGHTRTHSLTHTHTRSGNSLPLFPGEAADDMEPLSNIDSPSLATAGNKYSLGLLRDCMSILANGVEFSEVEDADGQGSMLLMEIRLRKCREGEVVSTPILKSIATPKPMSSMFVDHAYSNSNPSSARKNLNRSFNINVNKSVDLSLNDIGSDIDLDSPDRANINLNASLMSRDYSSPILESSSSQNSTSNSAHGHEVDLRLQPVPNTNAVSRPPQTLRSHTNTHPKTPNMAPPSSTSTSTGTSVSFADVPALDHKPQRPHPQHRGRVLLVEDNPLNARVTKAFLAKAKFTVNVASDGIVALKMLGIPIPGANSSAASVSVPDPAVSPLQHQHQHQHHYDCCVMDYNMPGLDGFETTKIIREWEKNRGVLKALPIIGLTANAMPDVIEQLCGAGMSIVLSKDGRANQLTEEVLRVVDSNIQ